MGKKRKILQIIGGTITLITVVYLVNGWSLHLDEDFVELSSCPACYGEGLCPVTLQDHTDGTQTIQLTGLSSQKALRFINYKNVYFGMMGGKTVVLKKLAHDRELRDFDQRLCESITNSKKCNVGKIVSNLMKENNYDLVEIINTYPLVFRNSDSIACNHSQILHHLYQKYNKLDRGKYHQEHFLTMLAVNPEPILINAFQHTGWFPALHGMCGRVIVEDYVGPSLSQLSHVSWMQRADYARQLLEMAHEFSLSEFRLYLTDVSLDNFAVDEAGRVKIIDAENIVLVDPSVHSLDTAEDINKGIGCRDCLSFSYEDLCSHTSADHNYFAICKGMLSATSFSQDLPEGLLHSPPSWVIDKYLSLQADIEACAGHVSHKSHHPPRRREAALRLHSHLMDILKKSAKYYN